jgi:hypothetical protein
MCVYARAFSLGDGFMEELVALCRRWRVRSVPPRRDSLSLFLSPTLYTPLTRLLLSGFFSFLRQVCVTGVRRLDSV